MMRLSMFSAGALLVAASLAGAASAQERSCESLQRLGDAPRADALDLFLQGVDQSCFGEVAHCASVVCQQVAAVEQAAEETEHDLALTLAEPAFSGVAAEISTLPRGRHWDALREKIALWSALPALIRAGEFDRARDFLNEQEAIWRLTSRPVIFQGRDFEIELDRAIEASCARSRQECAATYDNAVTARTAARLQRRLLFALDLEDQLGTRERIQGVDDQWRAYASEGRSQTLWELWINDHVAYACEEDLDARLCEPPKGQWIIAHPTIGLSAFGDDDDLQEALVLEVFGYYDWTWGSDRGSFLSDFVPRGGAAVLSFDGQDDPSYGVVAHWPNSLSLGATFDRDGDASLLLSLDLYNLVEDDDALRAFLTERDD